MLVQWNGMEGKNTYVHCNPSNLLYIQVTSVTLHQIFPVASPAIITVSSANIFSTQWQISSSLTSMAGAEQRSADSSLPTLMSSKYLNLDPNSEPYMKMFIV